MSWRRIGRPIRELLHLVMRVETYECLALSWKDLSAPESAGPGPTLEGRRVRTDELARIARDPDYAIDAAFLAKLRKRDDLCFGLFHEGRLVSYAFYSTRRTSATSLLSFEFPDIWIYTYKVFTLPEWRGKRLHRQALHAAIAEVKKWARAEASGKVGIIALVEQRNGSSIRSFERIGFRRRLRFRTVVLFSTLAQSFIEAAPGGPRLVQES